MMDRFARKEPYAKVRVEGDYTNWSIAGFDSIGKVGKSVKMTYDCSEYDDVILQQTIVENISDEVIRLTHVSSMFVNGIAEYDEKISVYICRSTWQGEMQWRKYSLHDLGVYRASNHVNVSAAKISFKGSQSTSEFYPMIMIEDTKTNRIWAFELEPYSGWNIEIGEIDGLLYVEMNSAFMCNDCWSKKLNPGEKYYAAPAFFAHLNGGFNEAMHALTGFKRKRNKVRWDIPPVMFNDYMNCLWAKPTDEKLIPLIDRASEVGCELFCIDDGWYGDNANALGDWFPNENLFGKYGFSGIIQYISDKGMIPGVWLEMESCSIDSKVYHKLKNYLLRRNGEIIGGWRAFLDFREKAVRDYTMESIDGLYSLGIRYIKNDYNHNICIGCDGADSLSEGLALHRKAFLDFIDDVKRKYSDLMIESCSSGAMRADFGFTKHMVWQSASDQEIYYNNPSVIAGALSSMPPEKCLFWSYPHPLLYENKDLPQQITKSDNEEIIFNMINAMLGGMCLSGRIDDKCGDDLWSIKEAIKVYKTYREQLSQSVPIYLTKPLRIYESGIMSIGLKLLNGNIIAAVWRVNSNEDIKIPLPEKYSRAILLYPKSVETIFNIDNNTLKIESDTKCIARLFLIS